MSTGSNMNAVVASHPRSMASVAASSSGVSTLSSNSSATNLPTDAATPSAGDSKIKPAILTTTPATSALSGPMATKKSTPSTMLSNNNSNNNTNSLTTTSNPAAPVQAATKSTTSNPIIASQPSATTNGSLSNSMASTDGQVTPSHSDQLSKTNLYIKGLSETMRDLDLVKMCNRFGTILSTKAIVDKPTGYCKGYGFVEFSSPQAAELAVQELNKSGIQAQMARISTVYSPHSNPNHHQGQNHRHHQHHNNTSSNNNNQSQYNNNSGGNNNGSNSSSNGNSYHHQYHNNNNNHSHNPKANNTFNPDPTNLYIANLPPNTSEQELENLLSTFGPVVSTRILRDDNNVPKGVGFARMESRDKCEQIIEQLNGRPYKGWKEPLLVKFADGGNKKRSHFHQQHQQQQHHHQQPPQQHHNNHHGGNHHQTHHNKVHQDDSRWRESGSANVDLNQAPNYDHQGNIPHSNQLTDLAMMNAMSYPPRLQPGYPAALAHGNPYAGPMGPSPGAPQWIHTGGPGQPYVIPQHMIQPGGLGPSNQAVATATLHYGHIPQLASQMQSLTIAHPGAPVGGYHMPGPHQWSPIWAHPIPQQAQVTARLPSPMQPSPPVQHQQPPMQPQQQQDSSSQPSNQASQQQAPFLHHHQATAPDNKVQVSMPL